MSVVAAAVVPHSPLLIPAIAGPHATLLDQTRQAIGQVAAEFHARRVETIIVLTPHGRQVGDGLTVNMSDQYAGRLVEFGDASTMLRAGGAPRVAQTLKHQAERHNIPVILQTNPTLDYGTTVPLTFFSGPDQMTSVLPLTSTMARSDRLVQYGRLLEDFFHQEPRRIGLLASADLIRRTDQQHSRPLPLERKIGEAIGRANPGSLLGEPADQQICGLAPILTLLSAVQSLAAGGQVLSFEAPLRVGLMTAMIEVPS